MFLYLDTADDVCPWFHLETARESNKASLVVCGRFLKHVLHPKNGTRSGRLYDDPSLTKTVHIIKFNVFSRFRARNIRNFEVSLPRPRWSSKPGKKTRLFIDRHFKSYTVSLNSLSVLAVTFNRFSTLSMDFSSCCCFLICADATLDISLHYFDQTRLPCSINTQTMFRNLLIYFVQGRSSSQFGKPVLLIASTILSNASNFS